MYPNPCCARRAFTLLELAVVLGVTALLMSALGSGLTTTKFKSKSLRCMNNYRQLMVAWGMYAADNREAAVYNFGITQTQNEIANQTYRNWANNILSWDANAMNTNATLLHAGILAPYFGMNSELYKCPADNYASPAQRALGWRARTRSVSMNGFFGPGLYWPTTSPIPYAGKNELFPSYRQWLRMDEVLQPAHTWVLTEEHPDSVNDGYFLVQPSGATSWGDLPASQHDGGSTLGFADAHVELHKWLSQTSRFPVRFFFPAVPTFDPLGGIDYQWLASRSAEPYR